MKFCFCGTDVRQCTGIVAQIMLLVGMLEAFLFIQFDSKTGSVADLNASVFVNECFVCDEAAVFHVTVHDLKNAEVGAAGCDLEGCRIGNGT